MRDLFDDVLGRTFGGMEKDVTKEIELQLQVQKATEEIRKLKARWEKALPKINGFFTEIKESISSVIRRVKGIEERVARLELQVPSEKRSGEDEHKAVQHGGPCTDRDG